MTRCALCCKGLPADDLAALDGAGRPICAECEQWLAVRHGRRDRWAVDLAAAAILAAVCGVVMWFAWGCATPAGGDRYQPWRGDSPIAPPGWTNGPAEAQR